MCGLVVLYGDVPDQVRLEAVKGAARRGPHVHGWGSPRTFGWDVDYGVGPIQDRVSDDLLIGHSRLATSGNSSGAVPDVDEAQPIVGSAWLLAHNGNIEDTTYVIDSEFLLDMLIVHPASIRDFLLDSGRPHAVVYSDASHVYLARFGHPLYCGSGDGWFAASSGPLTGGHLINEGELIDFRI